MAKYTDGMMGAFRGKVGLLIGSSWKGIPYIKSLPKRKKPVRENEQLNRNKFGMAHWWLKPVKNFVRSGFKGYSEKVEGFIAAKSYILKNAFEDTGADQFINPALVKVSYGNLSLPGNITAEKIAPDQIQFSWDISGVNEDNKYDQAMLLAYDIEKGRAVYNATGQFRHIGKDVLEIALEPGRESTYHLYLAFVAADRSRQSDSVYLGTINLG